MPVTVEEVIDEDQVFTSGAAGVDEDRDSDYATDSDADDDLESVSSAGTVDDETLYERVVALRDIVSPTTRRKISNFVQGGKGWAAWATKSAGTVAWVVTTSALLVGLPLALAMEDETRIVQQEKELQMQQSGQQQVS